MLGANKQTSQAAGAAGTPSNTVFVGGLSREMADDEIQKAIASFLPPAMKLKPQSLIGTTKIDTVFF